MTTNLIPPPANDLRGAWPVAGHVAFYWEADLPDATTTARVLSYARLPAADDAYTLAESLKMAARRDIDDRQGHRFTAGGQAATVRAYWHKDGAEPVLSFVVEAVAQISIQLRAEE